MVEARALIDRSNYFNPVEAYYEQFSYDLTASNERIDVPPSKIHRIGVRSVQDLLDALVRFGRRGEKNFLIATHGNPNGLPLRLRSGNPVTFNADIMDDMARAIAGAGSARSDLLDMQSLAGQKVFQNAAQLDRILDAIRTIRGFQLGLLEFRGCNIGAGPALPALHRLFGAYLTDGPTVQFFWSNLSTSNIRTVSDAHFQTWLSALGPGRRVFTDIDCYRAGDLSGTATSGSAGVPAVALGVSGQNIRINARSRDMVKGFSQSYLQNPILFALGEEPAGGGYRPGGRLAITGFLTPTGPRPFVIVGDSFGYTDFIARQITPAPLVIP